MAFPYSYSNRKRFKKIKKAIDRVEVKVDGLVEKIDGMSDCLQILCSDENPILREDKKIKFKVIL